MTFKKKLMIVGGGVVAALVAGEIVARCVLGLGDPPLLVGDPEIDYIFAPNQDCRRFGKRILYNGVSMRMDRDVGGLEVGKRRFIVVGDSVVNGGVLTTHDDLATSILDKEMRAAGAGDCLHVSAGS